MPHPNLPSSSPLTVSTFAPRKRIPASSPVSYNPNSSSPAPPKLPRRDPLPERQGDEKMIPEECLGCLESLKSKPIRTYIAAPIQVDSRKSYLSYQSRLFSVRNLITGALSIIIGGALLAFLLTLIGMSGILEKLSSRSDLTFQSVEIYDLNPLVPPSSASPKASPSQPSTSPPPSLPPVPAVRAVQTADIPSPAEQFIQQPVLSSFSHVPDLSLPKPFKETPQKEKPKETSDQTSKEKPKQTSEQATKKTSNEASEEATKQTSNQASKRSSAQPAAKSQYGISELDGTPRLLRHGTATFPVSLSRKGISRGTVIFEVELSALGSVRIQRVVSTTHPDLVEPARRVASSARFTPPKRDGQVVNAVMRWPIIIEK